MFQKREEKYDPVNAANRKARAKNKSLRITLLYFVFGCLWILLTDLLAERLFTARLGLVEVGVIKGLFYVTVTALFIFHLIYSTLRTLSESESSLRESERSKGVLLENLPGTAYRCSYDREWTMQFISEGCYELTGYRPDSLIGNKIKSYNDLIAPEYREQIWDRWSEVLARHEKFKGEYELITASGEVKWVFEQGQGVYAADGNVVALEGLIIDITDQKHQENRLRHIGEHDSLTGLFNRRYFEQRLEKDAKGNGDMKRAVVLLNLKRLNAISLTFGYRFSEKLIREVAVALDPLSASGRGLFRISFERFAFYLKGYGEAEELYGLCGQITSVLSKIKLLQFVGCGIGILEIDPQCCEPEYILRNASIAAERTAGNTSFGCRTFDDLMKAQVMRETTIKDELMHAVQEGKDGGVFLQYQPILDLKTNAIYGFEALARLQSKTLGTVSPLEFIPMAEEMQLIGPIGLAILREAGAFSRQLERIGYADMVIAVNISLLQLITDDFLDELIRIMEETDLPAHNLGLEITESVFSDNYEMINDKLDKIKGLGIRIAIDDFGSGYSSLARERELNVDCLKIDKYFIDRLVATNPEEALASDIISMAHKLGHCVVAEGVEHERQKQYLLEHGCDMMQGFLFSKPLDPAAAVALLRKTNLLPGQRG